MAKTKIKDKPQEQAATMGAPEKKSEEPKYEGAPEHSILLGWLTYSTEAARKKHWDYFVIDQFVRGNHNVRGNPYDNTIEIRHKTESINYPINKIFSTFRAVRAFVTRHKPVAEIEPQTSDEDAKTYARRANLLLERDNQLNNGRRLNKEWVYYGVKYGIGWRQIGYDQEKDVCQRWTVDPFDLLIGAKTGKLEDAPYVIKSVVRTIAYWKNKFPNKIVTPDNQVAADEYKRLSLQIQFQDVSSDGLSEDQQTAVGYECWYRLYKPNSLGGYINKCLFTLSEIIKFEETPYNEFPFIPYESEIMPNELYPDGHLKHVISPQRMYNLLNTQQLEYNHIVNRGRILKDKNAGFKVINAKEGQIIEVNPGKRVQFLNPPSINPSLDRQLDRAGEEIENLGGQHDASFGAAPERVSSGRAIEQLQIGDLNNVSDLRDNFEDALALEAAWILKMYSLYEKDGFIMNEEVDGETQEFAVVGKQAYSDLPINPETQKKSYFYEANGSYYDVLSVLPENQVRVSVTSQLGETKQAKLDLLIQLVKLGLPFKYLLEHLEFPNVSDIEERIAKESLAEIEMAILKQQATTPPIPGAPNGPLNQGIPSEEEAALGELEAELGGIGE